MGTSSAPGPIVTSAAGRIRGVADAGAGVIAFLGIPYGAPPTGALRFRPPEPARPWSGTLEAAHSGPAAPQPEADPTGSIVPGMVAGRTDEDCLSLNVWAPADAAPEDGRAVMVWIHGGAFSIGASTLPTYDPTALVREHGVVVVSPNYRLGALGFLAPAAGTPAAGAISANCGLADLVLALRWVAANAGAFGGDAGRVTVFGESAGAGAILHLLGAPEAAGLFRRAILQSPGVGQTLDRDQGAQVASRVMEGLGIDPSSADAADRLRALDVRSILDAQVATAADLAASIGAMPFHPVVDGSFLPEDPLAALRGGAAADVETVIGTTENEMQLFVSPALRDLSPDHLVSLLHPVVCRAVGRDPGAGAVRELVERYADSLAPSGGGPAEVWAAVMTDGLMRLPAESALEEQAAHQPGVFGYSFGWKPGGRAADRGSFHAIDLPFTFGTFGREGWGDLLGAGPGAEELSRFMRAAWARFAIDGRPGEDLQTGWPRWDKDRRATLVLDDPPRVADDPLAEWRKAWEALRHG